MLDVRSGGTSETDKVENLCDNFYCAFFKVFIIQITGQGDTRRLWEERGGIDNRWEIMENFKVSENNREQASKNNNAELQTNADNADMAGSV